MTLPPNSTTVWRPPIGRANATSSERWSSGWKSRVTKSMSCFGSTHIQVITIPKKKVCNFVGGEASPVLANVYLHYTLDLWFHKVVKPRCQGEACLIRYADDFVCAFQYQGDAERFYQALGQRLGKFGLALATDKTRSIPCSPRQALGTTSFDFLGFEFRWGKDRRGQLHLKRRTARKKLRDSQKRFTAWCKDTCRSRLADLFHALNAKLRGYYNYYGVHGNYASLQRFFTYAMRILFKWLNRRSQRRSYNWAGFQALLNDFAIERPRIVGRTKKRTAAFGA